jgi:iron complex outermembrane receptor protein
MLSMNGAAEGLADSQSFSLNIPAEPLEDALNDLAQQSGLQILFSSSLVTRLSAPPLKGSLTVEEALRRLLANRPLRFEFVNPHTVTIQRLAGTSPGADPNVNENHSGDNKMQSHNLLHRFAVALLAASPALSAGPAAAQEAPSPASPGELQAITVSASRITIAGYDQPTPVSVMGSLQIETEAKPDIADSIRQMPVFGGSSSPNNSYNSSLIVSGVQGLDLVSLRNLGVNRTLVLFDGQRVLPSNIRGGVDLSTVPSTLVDRVEVVTGGASAAWGSDAVAGVVNLIINKKFEGVAVNIEDGDNWQSEHPQRKAEISLGKSFNDDRGHFILSGNYTDSPDPYFINQMEGYDYQKLISNPACGATCASGQPALIHANNVGLYGYTPGGVITSGPLAGIQFVGPNGTPAPYNVSNVSGGLYATGPSADLSLNNEDPLAIPLRTYTLFGYGSYRLTDDINFSIQLNYGHSASENDTYPNYDAYSISPNNAYLQQILASNPGFAAQYAAAGSPSFTLGTTNTNNMPSGAILSGFSALANTVGGTVSKNRRELERGVFTLDGKIGEDWNWSAYYQHGETRANLQLQSNALKANVANAVNAVYVTPANVGTSGLPLGSIACASPTSGALVPGCAPLDVFGNGVASPEAIAYIQQAARAGQDAQTSTLTENVVAAAFQGRLPWGLPAGRIATAFGLTYRREAGEQSATALAAQRPRNFPYGNFSNFMGNYNVSEGFLEINAPLLKDQGVKSLGFNGALRETHYSTSGSVHTWKLGLTSKLIDDVAVRASYSRDIRAPDLQELFSSGTLIAAGNKVDPKTGLVAANVFDLSGAGNTHLVPEQATTRTAGIVFTPRWIDNFVASLDWYTIRIDQAIDSFGDNTILEQCAKGVAAFCSVLVFNGPGGALSQIDEGFINADSITTTGVDLAVDYKVAVGPGSLLLHLAGNYTIEETFSALGTSTNFVGSMGLDSNWPGFAEGAPKLKAQSSATYLLGPWSATAQLRFIGPAQLNNGWTQGVDIDNNHVPSVTYLDLRAAYKFDHFTVYAAIDNVTDRYPPILPFSAYIGDPSFTAPVRDDIYDAFGRVWRVGIRAKF